MVEIAAGWFWMGWERRPAGRATAPPRLARCLRHRPLPGDQSRVRALSRRTRARRRRPWWTDPRFDDPEQPVVGVELVRGRRATATGCRRRPPRGIACPPRRSGRRRRAADCADARFPWGEDRPGPAHASSVRRSSPTRPRTRSASPRSRASVTSGVSTGTTPDYYAVSPDRNPTGPATAPDASPAAAPGAIGIRGARWPIARPCRRRCATPTTASEWCARPIRPRSRRRRPQRSHERPSSPRAVGTRDTAAGPPGRRPAGARAA